MSSVLLEPLCDLHVGQSEHSPVIDLCYYMVLPVARSHLSNISLSQAVKGRAQSSLDRHPALSQQMLWDPSAGDAPVGAPGGIVWPWMVLPCCHHAHQLFPKSEQVPIALRKTELISSV